MVINNFIVQMLTFSNENKIVISKIICAAVFVWVQLLQLCCILSLFELIKPAACCYLSHEIVKFTLFLHFPLGSMKISTFEVGQFSREKLYQLQSKKKIPCLNRSQNP